MHHLESYFFFRVSLANIHMHSYVYIDLIIFTMLLMMSRSIENEDEDLCAGVWVVYGHCCDQQGVAPTSVPTTNQHIPRNHFYIFHVGFHMF